MAENGISQKFRPTCGIRTKPSADSRSRYNKTMANAMLCVTACTLRSTNGDIADELLKEVLTKRVSASHAEEACQTRYRESVASRLPKLLLKVAIEARSASMESFTLCTFTGEKSLNQGTIGSRPKIGSPNRNSREQQPNRGNRRVYGTELEPIAEDGRRIFLSGTVPIKSQ